MKAVIVAFLSHFGIQCGTGQENVPSTGGGNRSHRHRDVTIGRYSPSNGKFAPRIYLIPCVVDDGFQLNMLQVVKLS